MSDYSFQIAFCASALVISLTCLVFTFIMGRTDRLQNKLFILILGIIGINSLSEIICISARAYVATSDIAFLWYRIFQYLYFATHSAIAIIMSYYMMCVTGKIKFTGVKQNLLFMSPFLITEILVLTNPLTYWVYTYQDRLFARAWGEYLVYLESVLYVLFAMLYLLRVWKAMTSKRRITILYFFLLTIAGVVAQAAVFRMKVELLAEALGFLGAMLAIEDEDDRMDSDIDIHNRRSLAMDVTSLTTIKEKFYIICVKIKNVDIIERVTSSANTGMIAESVGGYLKTVISRHCIYRTSHDTFVLTDITGNREEARELAGVISDRFNESFLLDGKEVVFNAAIMFAEMGRDIFTAKDIFYLADSPVPKDNPKTILEGEDLNYLIRRVAVENAVNRGLAEHNFEVYYQPTYYLKNRKIHGTEALIRLKDPEMGMLFPDEFIPVAEQLDHIDEIDDFVLKQVCEFFKSGVPDEYGIETINVNLSVIECIRPGFVSHINKIVDDIGVDKGRITFEITETVQAGDYEQLSGVVKALKENGYKVAMDDYGTGYSNMKASFSLDYDLIKIDKSILWGAEKTELGGIILENSVRMIRQIKKKILVEGVETKEQLGLLEQLEIDYLQGYLFSRPVARDVLLKVITENAEKYG